MFWEFFTKEIKTALKSPMIYIFIGLMALLAGAAVASDSVVIGGAIGNTHKNAPYIITTFVLILGMFALLIAAAFFNNAALRDVKNNFHEIMFSLPIGKFGYFGGRFAGALVLSTIPLLGIFIGVEVGEALAKAFEWVDPERYGPLYWSVVINNYFLFILPNMFVAGSIIFFLAHKWQNTIVSFVGVLAIIVLYFLTGTLLSDVDNENIGALLDIFGIRTFNIYAKYWTPAEKNTLSPAFEGLILYNRLIWMGVGLLISALSYAAFNFKLNQAGKKSQKQESEVQKAQVPAKIKSITPTFSGGTDWIQFVSFFKINFLSILKSNVFKILVVFSTVLLVVSMAEGYEYFGLQAYPVTYKVAEDITGSTGLFNIIIVIFFAGELVWKDRTDHIDEVINATPHRSFSNVLGQFFALLSVAVVLKIVYIIIGIASQLLRGFTHIKLEVYLVDILLETIPTWFFFIALFMLIQTLLSNRYVGYFASILTVIVWPIMMGIFDISSNMVDLGSAPSIRYSDISGFGAGATATIWFQIYWMLLAVLLLFKTGFYFPRTKVNGFINRMKSAWNNASKSTLTMAVGVGVVWFGVGAFVYYNTQVLNPYQTSDEAEELRANYEKTYKKFENAPHPVITDAIYHIDIYPSELDVYTRTELTVKNQTDEPIDSIHVVLSDDWETTVTIPEAEIVLDDEEIGYRIYALAKPMLPGEVAKWEVKNNYITQGFSNFGGGTSVQTNGTFLNNAAILPNFGYSEGAELSDKYTRKKYGLEPKKRMPELVSPCGNACNYNYLTDGSADWVNVETFISTSKDQIAIAPGSLISKEEDEDRVVYHYKVDHPSQNFFSFMSAAYEVASDKYKDVDIEIYYDADHPYNIEKMIYAVKRSLAYYEANFGPYYHKQARIIEFPRYATFAQAFPGTMPYSESFGFVANLEDESENNVVDAVIAHEMAHQWWAHQEIPAKMQGGTFLTESFSEYSSLMVMKESFNDDAMRMKEFVKYDFNRYLRGRSSEREKELPLYKVENQSYIHYGKGAVVLYALQDYIGEDSVNAALAGFLEEYRYAGPPYPNSHDFLRHLNPRVPDSLKYLVEDMIMNIRLYDLRLTEATIDSSASGYQTTFKLSAVKLDADSLGNESEIPMNDWVDIGLYSDEEEEDLIAIKRVKMKSGEGTFVLESAEKPVKAAIDPKRLLIERVIDDNVKRVSESQ
jgi:hypothetical protein